VRAFGSKRRKAADQVVDGQQAGERLDGQRQGLRNMTAEVELLWREPRLAGRQAQLPGQRTRQGGSEPVVARTDVERAELVGNLVAKTHRPGHAVRRGSRVKGSRWRPRKGRGDFHGAESAQREPPSEVRVLVSAGQRPVDAAGVQDAGPVVERQAARREQDVARPDGRGRQGRQGGQARGDTEERERPAVPARRHGRHARVVEGLAERCKRGVGARDAGLDPGDHVGRGAFDRVAQPRGPRAAITVRQEVNSGEAERQGPSLCKYRTRSVRLRNHTLLTAPSSRSAFNRLRAWTTLPLLVVHRLGWTAPFQVIRLAWRYARIERVRLYSTPFASQFTSQPVRADAIRWMNPATVPRGMATALFAHPDSEVTWQVSLPARGRVAAWGSLVPEVWTKNTGGVRFAIAVHALDGALLGEGRMDSRPGTSSADRRWRRLSVPVGNREPAEVRVTLHTSVPEGRSSAWAWSVWGDPQIERDRGLLEMLRAIRAQLAERGLAGAVLGLYGLRDPGETGLWYQRWVAEQTPDRPALEALAREVAALPRQPLISVVMPVFNTDPRWLRRAVESVRAQVYPRWELCMADDASTDRATVTCLAEYAADPRIRQVRRATNGHISAASNDALALATGEFLALLDHDDELTPDALAEMVKAVNAHPDADLLYSDEDKLTLGGVRCDPFFKPDWSPEHFLGQMYTCHLTVARTSLVREVGAFRLGTEGTQDYDLWLRLIGRTARVVHVPKVLYHWRKIPGSAAAEVEAKPYALERMRQVLQDHADRNGLDAEVVPGLAPTMFRVKRRIRGTPPVTIVIPSAGRSAEQRGVMVDLLAHAVRHIADKTTWPRYQILVVDNGDLRPGTLTALEAVPHRRVSYAMPSGPFNFSRKLNFAVSHCDTEYFVIYNDDIEMITPAWIERLLEFAQDPAIGAVGCRLLFPDGRLQHVGVVTGVNGVAAHLFHQAPGGSNGWNGGAMTVRNYSVVTGAVMMTTRTAWDRVGGFDEQMRIDFNDVDYCLKLRDAGYRMVYTPFVEAFHHESGSFGARQQNPDDIANMERKWGEALSRDPYYNPNLTKDHIDCRPA
jgi:GT2 family glycosyltransferase